MPPFSEYMDIGDVDHPFLTAGNQEGRGLFVIFILYTLSIIYHDLLKKSIIY